MASSDKTHPFLEYYIHVSLEVLQKGGLGIYLSSLYSLLTTRQLCACVYITLPVTVKLSKEIIQPAAQQHTTGCKMNPAKPIIKSNSMCVTGHIAQMISYGWRKDADKI